MHDGCSGKFASGKEIVDKIRMMGFNHNVLPLPLEINCSHCDKSFEMHKMEVSCPACGMVYGVTPCHSHSADFVKPAGVGY